jgi:hypothetical protein
MAVAPFFFQILLGSRQDTPSGATNRSIFVQVSPDAVSRAPVSGPREKAERDFAEKLAYQAAGEIVEGQSASATEPTYSVAQLGALPKGVEDQPPALHRGGVRAWLI